MAAAVLKEPLVIKQGATWDFHVVWKDDKGVPVDMTGCEARMQFRHRHRSETAVLNMTTEDNSIQIDVETGTIKAEVDAVTTAGIGVDSGVFDLKIHHPAGRVDRILQGEWILSLGVTK